MQRQKGFSVVHEEVPFLFISSLIRLIICLKIVVKFWLELRHYLCCRWPLPWHKL